MALLVGSNSTTTSAVSKKTKFRSDIQGLRALAVVAVILDHFLGWPSGGFVGVDVFFVISGFLITSLLLREHDRSGTISFVGFYLRRAKRIMPAALLVIVATLGGAYALFSSTRFNAAVWDGVWAIFFGANWRLATLGTDYFQAGGPVSPLQHYWSLAVEEQFYFIWPWLMLLIFWALSRRRFTTAKDTRRVIGIVIVVLTVVSFAWSVWETHSNPSWAYFSTFSRAWELGVGAIVAVYASSVAILRPVIRHILGWTGLAGIIAAIFLMSDTVAFPGPSAALPVVAAALLILAGTGQERSPLWLLTNPVASYLGDISYSLYLWHFPVAILLLSIYPRGSAEYYVVGTLAILIASILSFHLVENPARKFERPKRAKYKTPSSPNGKASLIWLAVLAVITAGTVTAALVPRDVPASNGALAPKSTSGTVSAAVTKDKCWGAASLDSQADCVRDLGTAVLPDPKAVADDTGNSYACFPQKGERMKTCTYGGGTTHVALVGDSHAASLLPGLTEQAQAQGWKLDTYVGVGCIWATASCAAMPDIQAKLVEKHYDIVITSAYRGSGDTNKKAQAAAFADEWQPVAKAGSKIVVVKDFPIGAGPAVECVQRINFNAASNDCNIDLATAFKVEDAAAMAAATVPNSVVVDSKKYFCPADVCPGVIGNVLVYRDDISHITARYSKTLGPYLAKDIKQAAANLTAQ
ncbi:acyltransferase [Arthrobacter sp. ISL-85]|uniref:acyltransferase family protein n=1 Tax=Arthrobacter sp. ISL-85 TaxID=2819115 RepID=UPI001BE6D210|nr:acyltransferase family protein [Arthrobacter sp. ISL-85]MBT2568969.1 acyltransferase [Arthrobacter sp. ISL-85]